MSNEEKARSMGWVPLEEFRGGEAKWMDADTFVERGDSIMPILKSNNKRLEDQLQTQAAELEKFKTMFQASQESIKELQSVHAEATKQAVERERAKLKLELKTAREDGDVDRELEIQDDLAELKTLDKTVDKTGVAPPTLDQQPQLHPDFGPWMAENKWFGVDQRRTMRAMGIAQELRADPELDSLVGRAYFDKILEVMEEREGGGQGRTSKVGESRGSGGGSGGSGKRTYNDLPADAKDACERQGKKLVGEGRAFKDQTAWRSYYTNLYFQGEEA